MGGDNGPLPPAVSPGRGGRLLGALGALVGVGLVAVLAWRVGSAWLGGAPDGGDAPEPRAPVKSPRPVGVQHSGASTDGEIRVYDEKTGRLSLTLRFGKSVLKDRILTLEKLELRRVLDGEKGVLVAKSAGGVYYQDTGSGTLSGDVLVQRTPPGAAAPDLELRSASLAWDHAAGVLSTADRAEATWTDPQTRRKVTVAGTGLRAERWAETVRLARDVCVTLTESALPRLPLSGKGARGGGAGKAAAEAGPAVTVVTCSGPATFDNRVDLGCRRVLFVREVKAVRQEAQMTCNRLEILLAPDGGSGREGADVSAVDRACAGGSAAAVVVRGVIGALAAQPAPRREPSAKEGPDGRDILARQEMVDSVLATGAVVISGPEGLARGELAFFDRPGGCVWLDGGANEPAEVMRGENQLVSQSFHFNLRTEEMTSEGRGRATVIHKGDVKLPGKP